MRKDLVWNSVRVLAAVIVMLFFASNASATFPPPPGDGGCTLTQGYWKTHSIYGPAPYDDTWALIGENTAFYHSGQTHYEVLQTNPKGGNAYYILAHQFIAALLSYYGGATSVPGNVSSAWYEARAIFNNPLYTPQYIGALSADSNLRARMLYLAAILDAFNNGLIGPGHCTE